MTESTFITAWLVVGAVLGLAQFPLIVWLGARYGRTAPALGWAFALRLLGVATMLSWSLVGGHIVGVPVPSVLALYWALRDGTDGAVIVPLFTEGTSAPAMAELPDALRFLKEAHALKLRTEDWATDLDRIVADLRTHGIQPLPGSHGGAPVKRTLGQRLQRGLMWVGGFFVSLFVLGMLVSAFEDDAPSDPAVDAATSAQAQAVLQALLSAPPDPAANPARPLPLADVSGIWWSIDQANRRLRVQLTVNAGQVELQTDPFPVNWYPAWEAYARSVRDQGLVVKNVRFVGNGVLSNVMGLPRIELPYQAFTADGRGPLDTGSVVLSASADGRELTGQLWSNGEQAETPLRLVRRP